MSGNTTTWLFYCADRRAEVSPVDFLAPRPKTAGRRRRQQRQQEGEEERVQQRRRPQTAGQRYQRHQQQQQLRGRPQTAGQRHQQHQHQQLRGRPQTAPRVRPKSASTAVAARRSCQSSPSPTRARRAFSPSPMTPSNVSSPNPNPAAAAAKRRPMSPYLARPIHHQQRPKSAAAGVAGAKHPCRLLRPRTPAERPHTAHEVVLRSSSRQLQDLNAGIARVCKVASDASEAAIAQNNLVDAHRQRNSDRSRRRPRGGEEGASVQWQWRDHSLDDIHALRAVIAREYAVHMTRLAALQGEGHDHMPARFFYWLGSLREFTLCAVEAISTWQMSAVGEPPFLWNDGRAKSKPVNYLFKCCYDLDFLNKLPQIEHALGFKVGRRNPLLTKGGLHSTSQTFFSTSSSSATRARSRTILALGLKNPREKDRVEQAVSVFRHEESANGPMPERGPPDPKFQFYNQGVAEKFEKRQKLARGRRQAKPRHPSKGGGSSAKAHIDRRRGGVSHADGGGWTKMKNARISASLQPTEHDRYRHTHARTISPHHGHHHHHHHHHRQQIADMTRHESDVLFRRLDTNGDGSLSYKEIKHGIRALRRRGLKVSASLFWETADKDGDKEVTPDEFWGLMNQPPPEFVGEDVRQANEATVFGRKASTSAMTRGQSDSIFARLDANGDGQLSFLEIKEGMRALRDEGVAGSAESFWNASLDDTQEDAARVMGKSEFFSLMSHLLHAEDRNGTTGAEEAEEGHGRQAHYTPKVHRLASQKRAGGTRRENLVESRKISSKLKQTFEFYEARRKQAKERRERGESCADPAENDDGDGTLINVHSSDSDSDSSSSSSSSSMASSSGSSSSSLSSSSSSSSSSAATMTREEADDLFIQLDVNRDGALTFSELKLGIERLRKEGVKGTLKRFWDKADVDGSREIDKDEFWAVMREIRANKLRTREERKKKKAARRRRRDKKSGAIKRLNRHGAFGRQTRAQVRKPPSSRSGRLNRHGAFGRQTRAQVQKPPSPRSGTSAGGRDGADNPSVDVSPPKNNSDSRQRIKRVKRGEVLHRTQRERLRALHEAAVKRDEVKDAELREAAKNAWRRGILKVKVANTLQAGSLAAAARRASQQEEGGGQQDAIGAATAVVEVVKMKSELEKSSSWRRGSYFGARSPGDAATGTKGVKLAAKQRWRKAKVAVVAAITMSESAKREGSSMIEQPGRPALVAQSSTVADLHKEVVRRTGKGSMKKMARRRGVGGEGHTRSHVRPTPASNKLLVQSHRNEACGRGKRRRKKKR